MSPLPRLQSKKSLKKEDFAMITVDLEEQDSDASGVTEEATATTVEVEMADNF